MAFAKKIALLCLSLLGTNLIGSDSGYCSGHAYGASKSIIDEQFKKVNDFIISHCNNSIDKLMKQSDDIRFYDLGFNSDVSLETYIHDICNVSSAGYLDIHNTDKSVYEFLCRNFGLKNNWSYNDSSKYGHPDEYNYMSFGPFSTLLRSFPGEVVLNDYDLFYLYQFTSNSFYDDEKFNLFSLMANSVALKSITSNDIAVRVIKRIRDYLDNNTMEEQRYNYLNNVIINLLTICGKNIVEQLRTRRVSSDVDIFCKEVSSFFRLCAYSNVGEPIKSFLINVLNVVKSSSKLGINPNLLDGNSVESCLVNYLCNLTCNIDSTNGLLTRIISDGALFDNVVKSISLNLCKKHDNIGVFLDDKNASGSNLISIDLVGCSNLVASNFTKNKSDSLKQFKKKLFNSVPKSDINTKLLSYYYTDVIDGSDKDFVEIVSGERNSNYVDILTKMNYANTSVKQVLESLYGSSMHDIFDIRIDKIVWELWYRKNVNMITNEKTHMSFIKKFNDAINKIKIGGRYIELHESNLRELLKLILVNESDQFKTAYGMFINLLSYSNLNKLFKFVISESVKINNKITSDMIHSFYSKTLLKSKERNLLNLCLDSCFKDTQNMDQTVIENFNKKVSKKLSHYVDSELGTNGNDNNNVKNIRGILSYCLANSVDCVTDILRAACMDMNRADIEFEVTSINEWKAVSIVESYFDSYFRGYTNRVISYKNPTFHPVYAKNLDSMLGKFLSTSNYIRKFCGECTVLTDTKFTSIMSNYKTCVKELKTRSNNLANSGYYVSIAKIMLQLVGEVLRDRSSLLSDIKENINVICPFIYKIAESNALVKDRLEKDIFYLFALCTNIHKLISSNSRSLFIDTNIVPRNILLGCLIESEILKCIACGCTIDGTKKEFNLIKRNVIQGVQNFISPGFERGR